MKINRHNYEEFFLLYIDGELNAVDMVSVDQFVSENPDLKIELELLKEAVLPSSDITIDKSFLHKQPSQYVPSDERLMDYVDGELARELKPAFENELASNAVLRSELELLLSTRLDPSDHISFGDRSVLYKKEKGRLITMRVIRIAAAAAILLFIFSYVWIYMGRVGEQEVAVNANDGAEKGNAIANNIVANHQKGTQAIMVKNGEDSEKKNTAGEVEQVAPHDLHKMNSSNRMVFYAKNPDTQQDAEEKKDPEKKSLLAGNKTVASPVPFTGKRPLLVNLAPDGIIADLSDKEFKASELPLADYHSSVTENNDKSYVKTAALNESESNNTILYIPEDEIAKTRIGDVFRKVKKVVKQGANIKTANGIKVGGFQIALK
jgi:hypothetical protein